MSATETYDDRLREILRAERRVTHATIARRLRLDRCTVTRRLNGQGGFMLRDLRPLAALLDMTPVELFEWLDADCPDPRGRDQ